MSTYELFVDVEGALHLADDKCDSVAFNASSALVMAAVYMSDVLH